MPRASTVPSRVRPAKAGTFTCAFEPTAILLNVDTSQTKAAPAIFSIERRAEIPFAENTYFSSAPLRSAEHIEIVKAFEASLLG